MKLFRRGDTLIEVLFAFTILATIVGFAFTGALQSYKAAVAAQNQTQASLLAQYQAEALQTYRHSLVWAEDSSGNPFFVDGAVTKVGFAADESSVSFGNLFCMQLRDSVLNQPSTWKIQSAQAECAVVAKAVAPNLLDPTVNIVLTKIGDTRLTATITVSWQATNAASRRDSVVNRIILTREQ